MSTRTTLAAVAVAVLTATLQPDSVSASTAERARQLGGRIAHLYTAALNGFAVSLPTGLADRLRQLPGVVAVEQDRPVTLATTQSPVPWGLDRIDQRRARSAAPTPTPPRARASPPT